MRRVVGACLFCCFLVQSVFAQGQSFAAKKVSTPPKIDGIVDPQEWADVPSGSGFVEAQSGTPEPEKSTFWLCYDDKFIYFAAKLEDKNPKEIQCREYRSNVAMPGDDTITLYLDPFGRTDEYNQFSINACGANNLAVAGGRAAKREWLGEILTKGRITDTGWEVEGRIPWAVMRLPAPGVRDASFNVRRYDPRLGRRYDYRYSPNSSENYAHWTGVAVPKAGNPRLLKLLPYLYAGWDKDAGHIANAGLDMKTNLTDEIDAVASINPDFRNVENAILSLDFSYFARLAGETRPFFLEGNNFYGTSRDAPLFTSQSISSFDLGLKTFGKLNDKTNIAFLDAASFGRKDNDTVANVRYQPDPSLTLGAEYAGVSDKHFSNQGSFFSAFKTFGPWFTFAQHEQTIDSEAGYGRRINAGGGYQKSNWNFDTEYLEITPNFNPRIGFTPTTDIKGVFVQGGYEKPFNKGPVSDIGVEVYGSDYHTVEHDQLLREKWADLGVQMRNGFGLDIHPDFSTFRGSRDHTWNEAIAYPSNNPYNNVSLNYTSGEIGGIPYSNVFATLAYRPLKRLQVNLSLQSVRHGDRHSQDILGFNYDLGHDMSVSGRAVRMDRDTNAYVSLRRAGNAGIEYYFIVGDPNSQTFRKSLIVKLVIPFQTKL